MTATTFLDILPKAGLRILITGSRDWTDSAAITDAIKAFIDEHGPFAPHAEFDWVTVVHGAAPGADVLAGKVATDLGLWVERHPADWDGWRRKTPANQKNPAGMIRNQHMVDLGADVCLAFINPCRMRTCRNKPEHGSHGASRCAEMAEAAGIPVRRYVA